MCHCSAADSSAGSKPQSPRSASTSSRMRSSKISGAATRTRSTFLTRAIDQVMYDVGLHRQSVVFCIDRAGITGDDGASHHGVLDMALLSKVPGMTILAPSSYQELGQMLRDALDLDEGPVAIR